MFLIYLKLSNLGFIGTKLFITFKAIPSCYNFMSHKHKQFKNLDYQLRKKDLFQIKITTRISGETKNHFMNDLIKRGITEADLARDIIDIYYNTLKHSGNLIDKEIPEIKNYIVEKIKFTKS